jgi:hypothetical protein
VSQLQKRNEVDLTLINDWLCAWIQARPTASTTAHRPTARPK